MLTDWYTKEIIMDPFYPCFKYKRSADPKLDGTDYFIVAESMHFMKGMLINAEESFDCSLSFTCENDKKAFYKLIQDCFYFWFEERFEISSVNNPFSV